MFDSIFIEKLLWEAPGGEGSAEDVSELFVKTTDPELVEGEIFLENARCFEARAFELEHGDSRTDGEFESCLIHNHSTVGEASDWSFGIIDTETKNICAGDLEAY